MSKKAFYGPEHLANAIKTYYQYNPDTLMPILMLSLATQGKLSVDGSVKKGYTVFA